MPPDAHPPLLAGEAAPPSWLAAQLEPGRPCPSVTEMLTRLESSGLDVLDAHPDSGGAAKGARWEMRLRLRFGEEEIEMRLWVFPSEGVGELHLEQATLSDSERTAVTESGWSLGLSTLFGARPLVDFHRQLVVLAAVAHDAVIFLDVTACRAHGAAWVFEAARSAIPPSPEMLLSVHAVCPDEGSSAGCWLHTHGLLRCGVTELEMLDVPREGAGLCGQLINNIAGLFIERGVPRAREVFTPAAGMELAWLPWEKGVRRFARTALGGLEDRDDVHSMPSAVLFASIRGPLGRRLKRPATLLPLLSENPLFYVSDMETGRMAALAVERLGSYASLFRIHGDSEEWLFLVKLGYEVDGATDDGDREHLWFQVHELHGQGRCEATLLNEPYAVAGLAEGQRGEHDLSLMSDWAILCPEGRFDPDSILQLERILEQ